MLDPRALDSFVVAAETLNFSEAAARRNTVQSAISAQIRKLEEQLGQRLIDRGRGQAMSLTAEGRAFLAYAQRILNLSDEAMAMMQAPKEQRIIRLGTNVTLAMSVVARALKGFAPENPNVKIEILCDRSDALLPKLEAGEVDLALMMDQGKRADRVFVEHDQLIWVAGPGFTLQPDQEVPLVFLSDGRDLRAYAFAALDRIGRRGSIAHSSPHPMGVRSFVVADLAATVLPSRAIVAPLRRLGDEEGLPELGGIGIALYQRMQGARPELEGFAQTLHEEMQAVP